MTKYDDIINLPHHQSTVHPHMSNYDRSTQFAPFKSLSGYGGEIAEAARETNERIVLGEDDAEFLRQKLQTVEEKISDHPEIIITYFVPDSRKSGGKYVTESFKVKQIDGAEEKITSTDGRSVRFCDILEIEGGFFDSTAL